MVRVCYLAIIAFVVVAGCGPTPQQRYDDAAATLAKEQEKLAELRPAFDAAVQRASDKIIESSTGSTLKEALKGADLSTAEVDVDLSTSTLDEAFAAADKSLQQIAAKRQTIAQIDEVTQRLAQPGTDENKAFRLELAKSADYRRYRRLLRRVANTERELREAAAALPPNATK